jgi:hypothetical protein
MAMVAREFLQPVPEEHLLTMKFEVLGLGGLMQGLGRQVIIDTLSNRYVK